MKCTQEQETGGVCVTLNTEVKFVSYSIVVCYSAFGKSVDGVTIELGEINDQQLIFHFMLTFFHINYC